MDRVLCKSVPEVDIPPVRALYMIVPEFLDACLKKESAQGVTATKEKHVRSLIQLASGEDFNEF
jgi:hypothetical protein